MKENSNEIWKDIKGYEGLYQVSNFGRVKSLNYNRTQNEKILKPGNDCLGYYRISLSKCGKAKTKAKTEAKTEAKTPESGDIALSLQPITDSSNKNERVLALHKQGKSNVAIAKELGLGVGEVKLIIDLFKEM